MTSAPAIDWDHLRQLAREATTRAYAPYSHLSVGAGGLSLEGAYVVGSNIENSSLGVTLCAECSLVSDLVRQGGGRLVALAVVAGDGEPLAPCGRCRQLLYEHGGPTLLIDAGEGQTPLTLDQLLPGAFGPSDLDSRRQP